MSLDTWKYFLTVITENQSGGKIVPNHFEPVSVDEENNTIVSE